jgi:hypothetical protein
VNRLGMKERARDEGGKNKKKRKEIQDEEDVNPI